jgi:hypothetical protein
VVSRDVGEERSVGVVVAILIILSESTSILAWVGKDVDEGEMVLRIGHSSRRETTILRWRCC